MLNKLYDVLNLVFFIKNKSGLLNFIKNYLYLCTQLYSFGRLTQNNPLDYRDAARA